MIPPSQNNKPLHGNTFPTKRIGRLYSSFRTDTSFPNRFKGTDVVGQLAVRNEQNRSVLRSFSATDWPTTSVPLNQFENEVSVRNEEYNRPILLVGNMLLCPYTRGLYQINLAHRWRVIHVDCLKTDQWRSEMCWSVKKFRARLWGPVVKTTTLWSEMSRSEMAFRTHWMSFWSKTDHTVVGNALVGNNSSVHFWELLG